MYAAELEKVTKKLNRLFSKRILDGKKICLFGVSDNTRQIIKILRENGYEPVCIADNDEEKQNSYCASIRVVSADDAPKDRDIVWLMYSYYYTEMKLQLLSHGFKKRQIYPLIPRGTYLFGKLGSAFKGKHIYKQLKQQYGDVPIFLCPYTGTGDIYLIGTFWKQYIESQGIENYVFLVISGACKKVAMLFDIKNIALLKNQKDAGYLIDYYNLSPEEGKMKILNDGWAPINSNTSEWFRGYKGLYFTELFRKWVFDLPADAKPEHPLLKDARTEVIDLFEKNDLIPGKTVVLSPYSNTLADLPTEFWEEISSALIKKGYTVVTNSSGASEPAIAGSKAVFFPLNIAPQFINYAGGFIGIRSGFCDIISNCDAKKVILYDAGNRFYNCSAFEYFSLKGMGLCEDAIEILFQHGEINKVIRQILIEF